jgi:GT2 family glycosyltransferase
MSGDDRGRADSHCARTTIAGDNVPRVTIVVLTHNRRAEILRTLRELRALPEPAPIIVVDNASQDGTAEAIARRYPEITVIHLPENLGAAGRNYGVEAATTPYVAFCDDDTWWTCGSIARAVRVMDEHDDVAVVCARILIGEEQREDPTSAEMAMSALQAPALPGRPILGFMAGASVVRRASFLEVGGYCHRFFLGGEEELIALDLAARGWHLLYCPELTVHHHPSRARDSSARSMLVVRNALWVAGLRLPWRMVARRAARYLGSRELRGARLRTLWQTLRGLPWVLRARRAVPPEVVQMRARIDAASTSR